MHLLISTLIVPMQGPGWEGAHPMAPCAPSPPTSAWPLCAPSLTPHARGPSARPLPASLCSSSAGRVLGLSRSLGCPPHDPEGLLCSQQGGPSKDRPRGPARAGQSGHREEPALRPGQQVRACRGGSGGECGVWRPTAQAGVVLGSARTGSLRVGGRTHFTGEG